MVKDHSDIQREEIPLPPHGLLFPINSKGSFICTIPTDKIGHITAFVTPVVEHWLEREIAQRGPPNEGSIWRPIAPWANALTTELHLAPYSVMIYLLLSLPTTKHFVCCFINASIGHEDMLKTEQKNQNLTNENRS